MLPKGLHEHLGEVHDFFLGGGIQATLFDHLLNEGIGGILEFASARHVRAPICSKERITRLHKNPDTLLFCERIQQEKILQRIAKDIEKVLQ